MRTAWTSVAIDLPRQPGVIGRVHCIDLAWCVSELQFIAGLWAWLFHRLLDGGFNFGLGLVTHLIDSILAEQANIKELILEKDDRIGFFSLAQGAAGRRMAVQARH